MNKGPAMKGVVKFLCNAASAKPSPKIGQNLGPLGLNMMEFCKEFNERTQTLRPDVPCRVILNAYVDRSFTFKVKPPPTTWFLKKAAGVSKGSSEPKKGDYVGKVGIKYIYEIAKVKLKMDADLEQHDLEGICRMIIATAQSMGFIIVEDTSPPTPIHINLENK